jgi:hypothetical protein
MADRVFIPLPDGRWLALAPDAFRAALAEGSTCCAAPSTQGAVSTLPVEKLMSADEMEASTGVPASWWMTQARERRIPFRKIGRRVRFALNEVLEADAFKRRALPVGGVSAGLSNRSGVASG